MTLKEMTVMEKGQELNQTLRDDESLAEVDIGTLQNKSMYPTR